jgi:hypothetical protein
LNYPLNDERRIYSSFFSLFIKKRGVERSEKEIIEKD